jgi:hypothetical protein
MMGGAGCRKPLLAGCWAACKIEGVIGDVSNAKGAILRRGKQRGFPEDQSPSLPRPSATAARTWL